MKMSELAQSVFFHIFAGLPSIVLKGSWYCRMCVQENDAAAASAYADAEAAAKAAKNLSKKGKNKGWFNPLILL